MNVLVRTLIASAIFVVFMLLAFRLSATDIIVCVALFGGTFFMLSLYQDRRRDCQGHKKLS
jgi:hypothetical protein